MSRRLWQRVWQATFGSFMAFAFLGFYVFWSHNFGYSEDSAEAAVSAQRTELPACDTQPVKVKATSATVTATEAMDASADEGSDDVDVKDAAASAEASEEPVSAQSKMFGSRIFGPYALSVRDGLNEMFIGTRLMAQGVHGVTESGNGLAGAMTAIPSQLPADGYITSGFGMRRSPFTGRLVHHNGVDFAVPYGAPVYATADGTVVFSGWYHGLGRTIMLDHGYGIRTRYGHSSKLIVKAGEQVHRGQIIARAGSTGRSTGTHVHYEVWVNAHAIDPSQFMFEVPEAARTQLAMETYMSTHRGFQSPLSSQNLGLAMGGDGEPVAFGRAKAAVPTQADRLPLNLAIAGGFLLASLMMIGSLIPGLVREDDGL